MVVGVLGSEVVAVLQTCSEISFKIKLFVIAWIEFPFSRNLLLYRSLFLYLSLLSGFVKFGFKDVLIFFNALCILFDSLLFSVLISFCISFSVSLISLFSSSWISNSSHPPWYEISEFSSSLELESYIIGICLSFSLISLDVDSSFKMPSISDSNFGLL